MVFYYLKTAGKQCYKLCRFDFYRFFRQSVLKKTGSLLLESVSVWGLKSVTIYVTFKVCNRAVEVKRFQPWTAIFHLGSREMANINFSKVLEILWSALYNSSGSGQCRGLRNKSQKVGVKPFCGCQDDLLNSIGFINSKNFLFMVGQIVKMYKIFI
jgi:hypothetical protein